MPSQLSHAIFLGLAFASGGISLISRQSNNGNVVTDDTYFYGQSPPVLPELASGLGNWANAYDKARKLISKMTDAEIANLTVGYNPVVGCTGETGSVPRLGFPGFCFQGGTNGMRNAELVNSWAVNMHIGASWNVNLANLRGKYIAGEFRTKGANIYGGPTVGALGRVATGGRNWEGFSNDPYLAGKMAASTIKGVQDAGVIASVKHFIGNEQEIERSGPLLRKGQAVSANIDDRPMHELYLWPFADAIRAGAGAVMCANQRVNNSYSCQNSKGLNGLLKKELGFQGFVLTDWYAQWGGVSAAVSGLDIGMPVSYYWGSSGQTLLAAVNNGSLSRDRLVDMATRILGPWYQMGQDKGYPPPGIGLTKDWSKPHKKVNARDPAAKRTLLDAAVEGHVLVKNVNKALPLKKIELLSLFGYDGVSPRFMNVPDPAIKDSLGVINSPWGNGAESTNSTLVNANVAGDTYYNSLIAINGTIIRGGGSGTNSPAYINSPFNALDQRAYDDGFSLFWDFESTNPEVNSNSDACLVFINAYSNEGGDRAGLRDDYSDALVQNVAKKCNNTIVVMHNAGIRLVDVWIENHNVTAVIYAHLPGQDSGRALTQILFSDVSPSGKLPYTVAKNETDYNVLESSLPEGKFMIFPQSNFKEGLYIDYRHFDQANTEPRYEFGYGMTYTTFSYKNINVDAKINNNKMPELPSGKTNSPGGNPDLWNELYVVTATVANTGSVDAAEIAQLYISIPGGDTPIRQLRGFDKKMINAGDSATFKFSISRRDLSVWDVVRQNWVLRRGTYDFFVGASSRNLPLKTSVTIR